ncbi:flagellar protein FlaG [Stutzerimonas xanthomarina]|uniref:flagellar protein FlaG n=1 Tax=Stutzerimonas xanthomarina TaxID=271420 RepID=UPI0029AADE1B|nr:flagellar protein FlaG [Stutzerimonas xanthomarina]MDX2351358.1 flagellar protein FlaG [Stutzerimonas xanthomarina]
MDVGKISGGSALPVTASSSPGFPKAVGFSASEEHSKSEETADAEKRVDMTDLVERFRSQVQSIQRDLNFSVDDSTGDVVVQIIDGDSGKVVRQIPSEEILRLTERLDEMRSLMFEAKV